MQTPEWMKLSVSANLVRDVSGRGSGRITSEFSFSAYSLSSASTPSHCTPHPEVPLNFHKPYFLK